MTRRWTLTLFGMALGLALAAVAAGLGSAIVTEQADRYQQSLMTADGFVNFTDEQYAYVDSLWEGSGSLLSVVSPTVIAALAFAFAALALLYLRRIPR